MCFRAFRLPLCLVLLSGCAAGPRLKDYPERFIERPYTLPEGVKSFSLGLSVTPGAAPQIAGTAYLELPLNDTTSLEVPALLVRHQLASDSQGYWGLRGGLRGFAWEGGGASSIFGFWWGAGAVRFHRLTDSLALRIGSEVYALTQGGSIPWSSVGVTIDASLGYQFTDRLYASAGGLVLSGGSSSFPGALYTGTELRAFSLPFWIQARYSVSRQWDGLLFASLSAIGQATPTLTVGASTVLFW